MIEEPSSQPLPIAVITMVQATDFPGAWASLRTLDGQLGGARRRLLLLNDERHAELQADLASLPHTTVITPGRNLGVAIGRNMLIREALDSGAELIVSLDDDLYVPLDYLTRVERWFNDLSRDEPRLGVFGPSVLDFVSIEELLSETSIELGGGDPSLSTADLATAIGTNIGDIPPRAVYHLGIRNWADHYLRSNSPRARRVRRFLGGALGASGPTVESSHELRHNRIARESVLSPTAQAPCPVDTLPGGASVFPRGLVEDIGLLDERFAPFGYEDADFCIRALRNGYRNYWMPGEIVLHDMQRRSRQRSIAHFAYTLGRSRALLAANHADDEQLLGFLIDTVTAMPTYLADLTASRGGTASAEPGPLAAAYIEYAAGLLTGACKGSGDSSPRLIDRLASDANPFAARRVAVRGRPRRDQEVEVFEASWQGVRLGQLLRPEAAVKVPVVGNITLGLQIDRRTGAARVDPLEIDIPGFFKLRAVLIMSGVGVHDRSGEAVLEEFNLIVQDSSGVISFENSAAWAANKPSEGFLADLTKNVRGQLGRTIRAFVRIGRRPATLHVHAQPEPPVSSQELIELRQSPQRAQRRLGITANVLAASEV